MIFELALVAAIQATNMNGFSIIEKSGRYWFLSPSGSTFHSYGVCCVDIGTKRDEKDPLNPSYSAFDHYSSSADWANTTKRRLTQWGFNTVGAWSEHNLLRSSDLYQTPVLHLSATGIPWVDPWDADTIQSVDSYALKLIKDWKGDPNVIGYFSDNELGWWIGAIFEWVFKYKANSTGRKVLVDLLRSKYNTWEAVTSDFIAEKANSFDSLLNEGRLFLRPSSNGMAFVKLWLGTVAQQYYKISREAIKKADPNALVLGDRYISNYYPEVAIAASNYVDVISTNLNANWDNGKFSPFYLPSLHYLSKKPVLITEFYASAMENQSGNMNDSSGFPTVKSQKDRVSSFLSQVKALQRLPYVVGAHWFQYYDEGMHGREDGENYNMGLVDIYDKPYHLLTTASRKVFGKMANLKKQPTRVAVYAPYIRPYDAAELSKWDIGSSVLPLAKPTEARGDMFVSWNASGLYIGIHWYEDRFFEALYKGSEIPKSESASASIQINSITINVKADGNSLVDLSKGLKIVYSAGNGMNGNTRNTLIIRVPAKDIGYKALEKGLGFKLAATLSTRARCYNMSWATDVTLR